MSVFATIALVALLGGQKPKASPVVGDWITLIGPKEAGKEAIHLNKDGTFTLKATFVDGKVQTGKGKYEVKPEIPPGSDDKDDVSVYMVLSVLDGKAVPKDTLPPRKMGFYSKGPILTDLKAIVMCHPGDEVRVAKMFGDPKK